MRRTVLRVVGLLVLAASVAFLAVRLRAGWGELTGLDPRRAAPAVGAASVGYGLLCLTLSLGWKLLLGAGAGRRVAWRDAHRMYARSQVAKYLPGNVLHFGGRHALGLAAGFSHGVLAQGAVLEAASLVVAASAVAASGAAFFFRLGDGAPLARVGIVLAGAVTVPLLLNAWSRPSGLLRRWGWRPLAGEELRRGVLPALAVHAAFFLGAGLLLLGVVRVTGGSVSAGVSGAGRALTAFALAWILGYVTPGAPAGLGVREAVLTAALGPAVGNGVALQAALLLRVATVLGDAVYFATSLGRPAPRAASTSR